MAVLHLSGEKLLKIMHLNLFSKMVSLNGAAPPNSSDLSILRPINKPHQPNGGLKMLSGNLGKAVIKISAVSENNRVITAPAQVFSNEADVKTAYNNGEQIKMLW